MKNVIFVIIILLGIGSVSALAKGMPRAIGAERRQIENFSIEIPDGWGIAPSDRNTKAILYYPKGATKTPDTMIAFDIKSASGADTQAIAAQFAKQWNGTIGAMVLVDGVEAVSVNITSDSKEMLPRRAIIFVKNDNANYIILGLNGNGIDIDLKSIADSWKWDMP